MEPVAATTEIATASASELPVPSMGKKKRCSTFKKVKNLPANRGPRKMKKRSCRRKRSLKVRRKRKTCRKSRRKRKRSCRKRKVQKRKSRRKRKRSKKAKKSK